MRFYNQGRLSGPLLDRIDLQVEVPAVPPEKVQAAPDGETTAAVAARVALARQRQQSRQGCANAGLQGDALDAHCRLAGPARQFMAGAAARLGWSARGLHRALRVARSVADLAGSADVQTEHIAEAIQYRRVLQAK